MTHIIKIAIVILHYNTIIETINCVDSIVGNIDAPYKIIIVDNASPNHTGIDLKKKFEDSETVDVIISNSNVGFARGNNIGISYARKKYTPEFICCINNDTILCEKHFYKKVKREFDKSHAAIIGPRIILRSNYIQTSGTKLRSIYEYKNSLQRYIDIISRIDNGENENDEIIRKDNRKSSIYIKSIKRFFSTIKRDYCGEKLYIRKENVVLHGCCIIFTPSFFLRLNGFDDRTFLFREEELLYIAIKNNDLKSVYCPKIRIRHLEDAATDSIFSTTVDKRKFICSNQIDSLRILISELEKDIKKHE